MNVGQQLKQHNNSNCTNVGLKYSYSCRCGRRTKNSNCTNVGLKLKLTYYFIKCSQDSNCTNVGLKYAMQIFLWLARTILIAPMWD